VTEQLDLAVPLPPPEVTTEQIERLVGVLGAAGIETGGWLTAAEIAALLGARVSDRTVRKIASAAAPVVVSYPGSPGYKLWARCEVEEINHCIEAFESQGRDMMKRAVLYRQAYHRRFRGAL